MGWELLGRVVSSFCPRDVISGSARVGLYPDSSHFVFPGSTLYLDLGGGQKLFPSSLENERVQGVTIQSQSWVGNSNTRPFFSSLSLGFQYIFPFPPLHCAESKDCWLTF